MNKYGIVGILVLVVAIISAGVTRYYFPKIEVKNVEVTKEVVRNDIKTVTRIVERPDGTKESVIEVVDKSIKKETIAKETTIAAKSKWLVGGGIAYSIPNNKPEYELSLQKRVIGPLFLGGKVTTAKTIGLTIGMEF
jgi:O-acetyl-ADP-ribose deacetylase (regulator of RNase III)